MIDEHVIGEKSGVYGAYRVVARVGVGIRKRQMWVQRRYDAMVEGEYQWRDVWGPYFQRPSALRTMTRSATGNLD